MATTTTTTKAVIKINKIMKYLKLKELENGKFYKCRLSGKQVLLNEFTWDVEGNPTSWQITYYSDVTGFFQTHFPTDYQLSEIEDQSKIKDK